MERIPNWVVAVVTFIFTMQLSEFLHEPPRLIFGVFDNLYSNQCRSAEWFGVTPGMSRRDVVRHFRRRHLETGSDWYIEDDRLGLPPDALAAPVWPMGRLPDYLETARDWTLLRAGYSSDFKMNIHFEGDRVQCADVEVHVPMF